MGCTGASLTGEYVLGCANFSIFKIFLMLSGPVKVSCATLKYQLVPPALPQILTLYVYTVSV